MNGKALDSKLISPEHQTSTACVLNYNGVMEAWVGNSVGELYHLSCGAELEILNQFEKFSTDNVPIRKIIFTRSTLYVFAACGTLRLLSTKSHPHFKKPFKTPLFAPDTITDAAISATGTRMIVASKLSMKLLSLHQDADCWENMTDRGRIPYNVIRKFDLEKKDKGFKGIFFGKDSIITIDNDSINVRYNNAEETIGCSTTDNFGGTARADRFPTLQIGDFKYIYASVFDKEVSWYDNPSSDLMRGSMVLTESTKLDINQSVIVLGKARERDGVHQKMVVVRHAVKDGKEVELFSFENKWDSMSFAMEISPDGKFLVVTSYEREKESRLNQIVLYNMQERQTTLLFHEEFMLAGFGEDNYLSSIKFDSNSCFMWAAFFRGPIMGWQLSESAKTKKKRMKAEKKNKKKKANKDSIPRAQSPADKFVPVKKWENFAKPLIKEQKISNMIYSIELTNDDKYFVLSNKNFVFCYH
jgi:hypothetical protein